MLLSRHAQIFLAVPLTVLAVALIPNTAAGDSTIIVPIHSPKVNGLTIDDVDVLLKHDGDNSGETITNVSNGGGFTAPDNKLGHSSLHLTGGTVAPGATTNITLNYTGPVATYTLTEISYKDGTIWRAKSVGDDIFSKAVFGGATGTTFAGVFIPTNQWGYFYQFDRNITYTQSPTTFELAVGGSPTGSGFVQNTWSVSQLAADLPTGLASGTPAVVTDSMTTGNLTGSSGITPSSWSYSNGMMTALYTTPFAVGDVASILWYTSSAGPDMGGPLGNYTVNATLNGSSGTIYTNTVISSVPEPSSLVLVGLGMAGLLCYTRHRKGKE